MVARKYAHKIPFVLKLNHNETLTYPNIYIQTMFARVEEAWNMGCAAVGATIYFGSPDCRQQIEEVSQAFAHAHELGMGTILWCYLRNEGFTVDGTNYETAADLTGQANHLGATLEADILKQKQPDTNGGYQALNSGGSAYGKLDDAHLHRALVGPPDRPHALPGRQRLHGPRRASSTRAAARARTTRPTPSGRPSSTSAPAAWASSRAARRSSARSPRASQLLNAIQDVYLNDEVTVA